MSQTEVHFEAGMHPLGRGDDRLFGVDKVKERFLAGDIDAHSWNGAVVDRMSEYRPDLVTIDGLKSYQTDPNGTSAKHEVWIGLPGRPSAINGTDTVRVLAADNFTFATADTNRLSIQFTAKLTASLLAALTGGYFILKFDNLRWQAKQQAETDTTLTRRRFLLGLGGALTSIGVIGVGGAAVNEVSMLTAGVAQSESLANAAERVYDATRSFGSVDYSDAGFVNGRTALLIAKTHDAIDRYNHDGYNVGSVVMGASHIAHASELTADPSRCDALIVSHTRDMLRRAENAQAAHGEPNASSVIKARIKAAQQKVLVYDVKEPDERQFREDPVREVDRCVTLVDKFDAPRVAALMEEI